MKTAPQKLPLSIYVILVLTLVVNVVAACFIIKFLS